MSRIIIRPMYKTDPGYIKGMEVAIDEDTGKIIRRHFDNVSSKLKDEEKKDKVIVLLNVHEIDWVLAGYENDLPKINN
jgi:transcriptional accessory protein Tex/SPT6